MQVKRCFEEPLGIKNKIAKKTVTHKSALNTEINFSCTYHNIVCAKYHYMFGLGFNNCIYLLHNEALLTGHRKQLCIL